MKKKEKQPALLVTVQQQMLKLKNGSVKITENTDLVFGFRDRKCVVS